MVEGGEMRVAGSQRSEDYRVWAERVVKWLTLGCDATGKIEASREAREKAGSWMSY